MLSLLTPDYQQSMTQQNDHETVNHPPQWSAAFRHPAGPKAGGAGDAAGAEAGQFKGQTLSSADRSEIVAELEDGPALIDERAG